MKPEKKNRNKTGLPDNLKSGIENLSGQSMDDVKVHYSSDKPAQLQAHAYAQGTDIHLGAGQEKHLPHEAWHVIQQKQGRVKPTLQGLSKISLYNNLGRLDENLPFHLFGPLPSQGSYLLFGSSEWLNKRLTEIKVQLFWEKNIPNDFASYYSAYPQDFKNTSFKVAFSILKAGVWEWLYDKSFKLFEDNKDGTVAHTSTFKLNLENNLFFSESPENSNEFVYYDKTSDGFVKMQLVDPIYGFGNELYENIYTEAVLKQAKLNNRSFWEYLKYGKKRSIPQLFPSLPYVPLVDKIKISITYMNSSEKGN